MCVSTLGKLTYFPWVYSSSCGPTTVALHYASDDNEGPGQGRSTLSPSSPLKLSGNESEPDYRPAVPLAGIAAGCAGE